MGYRLGSQHARAHRHIQAGYTYHVTHRCHDRAFLLRFARDRQDYRAWLIEGLARSDVRLLTYCITSNHVHLLLKASSVEVLALFMQRVAGGMAQAYNQRKGRTGAFWSARYHAVMIEDGDHLGRCMRNIDLNMVRAGAVAHPSEWEWTGWRELMGERRRNRLLCMDSILAALDVQSVDEFRKQHAGAVAEAIRGCVTGREPWWTESVAVGSVGFAANIEQVLKADYTRRRLQTDETSAGVWVLREPTPEAHGGKKRPENRPIRPLSTLESHLTT